MSRRRSSLAARVSVASLASAALAAAVSAVATCGFADAMLTGATDRALLGASAEVAAELGRPGHPPIGQVVRDEELEVTSTGVRFAVLSATGARLAGELPVAGASPGCARDRSFRVCTTFGPEGVRVVAGARSESRLGLFTASAFAASALAAIGAWALGTILARRALAPLASLEARIAALRLELAPVEPGACAAELGETEGVREVDALRQAVSLLHGRMSDALAHSARFAANAAHELRTPLTAVRGELELLLESLEAPAARADGPPPAAELVGLRRALRRAEQLQGLVERLLLLALPEVRGGTRELLSLRDVVEDTLLGLSAAERARVTVAAGEDVLVHGDGAELGMVVSNGVANALKFGAEVAILIRSEGADAVLTIEDDGPGVPEPERAKVFEPFVRGTDTRRAPGHGLGLALVAHIARRHGGDAGLSASRTFARGARLEVRLPAARGGADEGAASLRGRPGEPVRGILRR